MLLASDEYEANELQDRAEMLQRHGIRAAYHTQSSVKQLEPALELPEAGGALLVESDTQLVSACCRPFLFQLQQGSDLGSLS